MTRRTLRRRLLAWYDRHRRDLPWRRSRDPYAIWISETMLQQTRVETVIPYYERFLARFPDVNSLAEADSDDVLGLWAGLGYYSRARNLHRAAKQVATEFDGDMPSDAEALQSLPGVGRYTAGAVASIAFDRPAPIVDGNVARVFARIFGIREDVKSRAVQKRLWEEAATLARGTRPGDLNQAVMELGATVCTPRSPSCGTCPIASLCEARATGDAETLPVMPKKAKPLAVTGVAAFLTRRGKVLAVRRPPEGLLGGLWELPGGEAERGERPEAALTRQLEERLALAPRGLKRLGAVSHVFSHRTLRLHVFHGEAPPGRLRRAFFDAHRWVADDGLDALPQSAVMRKALVLVRDKRGAGASRPSAAQPSA